MISHEITCVNSCGFFVREYRQRACWNISCGYPTFISELYAGRSSDKQVTRDCRILNMLEPGDDVMAEWQIDIEGDTPDGVKLNIPCTIFKWSPSAVG